ncbi:hypothetical protein BJX63DRAFT_411853 [Aspergillus granulosus]|uniref:Uncharacterized protein n=1 Tax=Aspergillus granulosus TaxID=176169 RepID=A0ABR4GY59_9EURO
MFVRLWFGVRPEMFADEVDEDEDAGSDEGWSVHTLQDRRSSSEKPGRPSVNLRCSL